MAKGGGDPIIALAVVGGIVILVTSIHWVVWLAIGILVVFLWWAYSAANKPMNGENPSLSGGAEMQSTSPRISEEDVILGLLTGLPPWAQMQTYMRTDLRLLQIIGESIQLVLDTKNDKTCASRMKVVEDCLLEFQSLGLTERWISEKAREMLTTRVEQARAEASYRPLAAPAIKAIAAARRYVKSETKQRYFRLAIDEIATSMAVEGVSPEVQNRLLQLKAEAEMGLQAQA